MRAEPTNAAAQRTLAERLEAEGRGGEALRARQAVARLRPDDAMAALELARAQEHAGRYRDALRSYERFTELAPDEPRGHELVGWMRLEMGRHRDALAAFRQATRPGRATAQAHYGAALTLAAMDRRDEAMQSLHAALAFDSTRADYWGQLAVNAHALARPAEAVRYWDRALRADPAYFDVRATERKQWETTRARLAAAPAGTAVDAGAAPMNDRPPAVAPAAAPAAAYAPRTTAGLGTAPAPRAGPARDRRGGALVGPDASGSGFMIAQSGYVITNKHVIRACREVKVRVGESTLHSASVVAAATHDDLALLRVDVRLPGAVVFRDAPALRAGEDVVATGYPLTGLLADEVNVTVGTVSALAGMRNDSHILQMTAPVQPGSSGGPLFDASGHLIGVVVTKLNARIVAEETGDIPQNVNFAVKATVLRDFLDDAGIEYRVGTSSVARPRADIGDLGRAVTVMVQCFR
ncbi:MAG TPA: trypsin-like peptidase domain-containing protein [Gemmatimonadaceae bacterium]|nr:trypsin-like peptidase domain-containing protein [Gemmatimonadaceae bacterium]